jgi:hypothetical protein
MPRSPARTARTRTPCICSISTRRPAKPSPPTRWPGLPPRSPSTADPSPRPADTGILGTAGPAGFGKAASISAADLGIVASTSEATTGSVSGPLVIGNEARLTGNSSEGLLGRVDEVRVSMVARDDAGDNGISISHSLP